MSKETGGPAFPREDYQCNGDPGRIHGLGQEGMTMRDYFAAKALQGWLASYGPDMPHPAQNGAEHDVARNAYKLADAMLAARGE